MKSRDIDWWLVYGPGRSGTSYVSREIGKCCRIGVVSDWSLGPLFNGLDKVTGLDKDRLRADLKANILDNVWRNAGFPGSQVIDMAYKQAGITRREFAALEELFGAPQRIVFCLRDPASYMASAVKKFSHAPVPALQDTYLRMFEEYAVIGGDVLHYGPHLTAEKIADFLQPLPMRDQVAAFKYAGSDRPDLVTPKMTMKYEKFRDQFVQSADTE